MAQVSICERIRKFFIDCFKDSTCALSDCCNEEIVNSPAPLPVTKTHTYKS
jgi:hypothetical protein